MNNIARPIVKIRWNDVRTLRIFTNDISSFETQAELRYIFGDAFRLMCGRRLGVIRLAILTCIMQLFIISMQ